MAVNPQKQLTDFGAEQSRVDVTKYDGPFSCDQLMQSKEGNYAYCTNGAIIKVGDKRFCKMHASDTHLDMSGVTE